MNHNNNQQEVHNSHHIMYNNDHLKDHCNDQPIVHINHDLMMHNHDLYLYIIYFECAQKKHMKSIPRNEPK